MITVTLYTRKNCHLCEQAEQDLKELAKERSMHLVLVDIDADPVLQKAYALEVPVVEIGPYRLKTSFTRQDLAMTLGAASDRSAHLEQIKGQPYRRAVERDQTTVTRGEKISYWISRHYLLIFNLFLFLYVGLPFLAPVFKKAGWNLPAQAIYKLYSPLCHQWAFRSYFLFGEQPYYPHQAANLPGVTTFEKATGITDQNDPGRMAARDFEGNDRLGYKVALCERDVAIWGCMLLFGLLYAVAGRRIPRLHWILWILLGIVPPGLDGFSQLLSQFPLDWVHALLPYRESTPFLRTLTGAMFGFFTAWFIFPLMEEVMDDTRRMLARKFIGTVSK